MPAHADRTGPDRGARAAYQVGVLSAIMELLDPDWHSRFQNPFDIICGTSAGAINAAALACRADRPHLGVRRCAACGPR